MRVTACAVVSLMVAAGLGFAQGNSRDEAAIRAVEEKWDAASVKGDAAALATIWADTFFSTTPEGKVRTRAEMLAQLKSGAIKYHNAKADDLKISVYGDAAVVSGRWKGKFTEDGKMVDATERFTDTFIRQNGQWRCVASHASTLK